MDTRVNEEMYRLGSEPSAIRELFAYGLARKAAIGEENVFDFSLGNPSVPAPDAVRRCAGGLLEGSPLALHGYTPAPGAPQARQAIAASINRRFGMAAQPGNIYLTAGAAAALALAINAVASEGDEIVVVSPYFPEYRIWIEHARCSCVEVPARPDDFQLDLAALEAAITPRTRAVIINSPNNPVGVVYTEEGLRALAALLAAKQKEYGRAITVISDEPYREIVYDGLPVPYVPALYADTIVCYSYSKSLGLPGERIGYLYVSERMPGAAQVFAAVCGAGRALGFVCAPSLFQGVVAQCVDEPPEVAAYAKNRRLLTKGLAPLGYDYVEPQGAFYLWVRSLEPDQESFAARAKSHELLLVPSTSFGCQGYVRIGYCVSEHTITAALPAFAALAEEYRS